VVLLTISVVFGTSFSSTYVPRVSATPGNLTEWTLPDSNSGPWGIAVDQSNKVWFTENVTNRLGRLDSVNSQLKEWAIPGGGNPKYIFLKPSGSGVSVYFAEYSTGKIGRFDNASNTFYEWTLHDTSSRPVGIYVDQDDHIWTTLSARDTIAEIIPLSNVENDYVLPTNGQFVGQTGSSSVSPEPCGDHQSKLCPWGIYVQTVATIGTPNKFVWFTESNNNAIGRLEINSHLLTTFKLGSSTDYGPLDITLDASGNVLFTGSSAAANRISMIRNQSNTFADFFVPSSQSKPTSVKWDPVHNLAWFTENNGGKVTSLDTSAGVFALIPTTIVCTIPGSPPGVNAPNCDTFAGGNSGANFFGSLGILLGQNSGFPNTRTVTAVPSTLSSQGFGVFSEYVLSPTISGPNSVAVDGGGGIWFTEQQTSGNRIGYLTITVGFDFGFSANTSSATVSQGQSASFTLSLTLISGNAQTVALSISPAPPAGVSPQFNPTSGTPPFTSTLTLGTTSATPTGTYALTLNAVGGGVTKTVPIILVVTAPSSSLLFNPNSGPAGIVVNSPGSGPFSPSDVGACSITANPSSLIASVVGCTISINGYVTVGAFIVASAMPGPYIVTVKGSSGDSISGIFTVTRLNLMLQPTSGPVGTVITVSGSGFASNDIACVVTSTPSGMVTNSGPCIVSNGVLTPFKFTVGNVAPVSYLIQVKGTAKFDITQATFTVTGTTSSNLTVSTDSGIYSCGNNVMITAIVASGSTVVTGVAVVFEIRSPSGSVLASGSSSTDSQGYARFQFTLPSTCQTGTYTVFASTTIGTNSLTASANFSVSTTATRAHVTINLLSTDTNGNAKSQFARGETVLIKVVVNNDGTVSLSNVHILLTIFDSNNAPIFFGISITSLNSGGQQVLLLGTPLASTLPTGTFSGQVIVLTDFLASGGSYIPDGSGTVMFSVT